MTSTAATTDLNTESKIQHSEQFSHGVASHRGLHPEVPVKYGVANIVNFVTVEGEPVRMSQGGVDTYADFHSASFAASCIARRREGAALKSRSQTPKVYTNVQSIDLFDRDGNPGFSMTLTQTKVFSTEEERDEALKSHSQTPDAHAEIARLKEENERLEKKNKKLDEGCRVIAQVLGDTAAAQAEILQDAANIGGEIREVIETLYPTPPHSRGAARLIDRLNTISGISEKLGWLGTPFNETSEF